MVASDYLLRNTDRHLNNFGIIRDVNTLKWLDFAPIYDTGASMWDNMAVEAIHPTAPYDSKPFNKNSENQIKLVSSNTWKKLNELSHSDYMSLFHEAYLNALNSAPLYKECIEFAFSRRAAFVLNLDHIKIREHRYNEPSL